MPVFKCSLCKKLILTNHNSIFCDVNNHCVHAHCAKLFESDFQFFCDEDDSIPWCCPQCTDNVFLFQNCSDFEFTALLNARKTYFDPTALNSFFQKDNDINSKNDYYYFNTDDNLHNTATITQSSTYMYSKNTHIIDENLKQNCSLIMLHINIRSLPANFAKLQTLISFLHIKPHIISINETCYSKINKVNSTLFLITHLFLTAEKNTREGVWHYISKTISLFALEMT